MAAKVGPKGQVVIEKQIRDELGIEPGSLALQPVVGDHVEIRFVPGAHRRSLKGVLSPHVRRRVLPEGWNQARDEAWEEVVREREARR